MVALIVIVHPPFYAMIIMAYIAPMAIYEIGVGLWLLSHRLSLPPTGADQPARPHVPGQETENLRRDRRRVIHDP